MGKINQGILGGFSGKVGAVIGSSWKGIAYMRGIAQSIHNPRTDKQMHQRDKFALISRLTSKLLGFMKVGFRGSAVKMSEMNASMRENINKAIGGTWPNYEVRYDQLEVSKGSLDLPYNPSAAAEAGLLTVSWTNNAGIGNAKDDDMAMVLVYNSAKQQSVYNTLAGKRSEREAQLSVPSAWNGDNVEVWLAFISEDGSTTSASAYLGSLSV